MKLYDVVVRHVRKIERMYLEHFPELPKKEEYDGYKGMGVPDSYVNYMHDKMEGNNDN